MQLNDFRQQYPQYNDMSDQQLADALYNTHYSDMPRDTFYQKIGYTPASTNPITNAFQSAAQAVAPINVGAQTFVGNILQDIGNAINSQKLSQLGQNAVANAPQTYGLTNPNLGQKLLEGIAQYAPYALGAGEIKGTEFLSKIPMIGRLLSPAAVGNTLAGGVAGATQDPNNPLRGGLEGAATAFGLSNISPLFGAAKSAVNTITGKTAQNMADNFYQNISKGVGRDTLNKQNFQNIVLNYKNALTQSKQDYNDFADEVAGNGYATKDISNPKYINPSQPTAAGLQRLLDNDTYVTGNPNISKQLTGIINKYLANPSYENAHALQSDLGQEAADFGSGLNTNRVEKLFSGQLNNLRNNLKNDIIKNFNDYGDEDFAQRYQQLSNNFAQNVMPYRNVQAIWRGIRGGNVPADVSNTLSKDDITGNYEKIRQDLMNNEEQSQSIVAQSMQKFLKKDESGVNHLDINSLRNYKQNLPDNISRFMEPANLEQQIARIASAKDLSKYAKYVGAGIAAVPPIAYGAEKLLGAR